MLRRSATRNMSPRTDILMLSNLDEKVGEALMYSLREKVSLNTS